MLVMDDGCFNVRYSFHSLFGLFSLRVLGLSSGIDDIGSPRWDLVLSLLLAWVISYLCMVKGIKTTGKVRYMMISRVLYSCTLALADGVVWLMIACLIVDKTVDIVDNMV